MFGLLCKKKWKGIALLFSVPLVVLGCGDFGQDWGDSGSRLIVEQIEPTYFDEATNQVDVIQDDCADPGDPPDAEPYSDHFAVVSMSNRALNNATKQTASTVRLETYDLHYTPVTVGSPELPSSNAREITESVAIDACLPGSTSCPEVDFTVELVPIPEKDVLGGYLFANPTILQLQYNVHYIFYGENDFGEPVSVDGYTFFYATDYDNCGGG